MSPEHSFDAKSVARHRVIASTAVIAIVAWASAGFIDRSGRGRFDPLFEPNYAVLHAPEGGTLALAGFQPGDSVVSVEGIPVTELGMYSRWPRSLSRRPGEALTLEVERDGHLVSGDIVLREASSGNLALVVGGIVIALAFVAGGLWALFSTESVHGVRLAYIGLALGAGIPGPYLGTWDGFATHFQVAVLVLWTLLLLRFFLAFPEPKRAGESRLATALIYGGWAILLVCLALELTFHPRFYHTFGPLYGLLMLVYSTLALGALVHTFVKTPPLERRVTGMNIILVGVVVALVPTAISAIDRAFLWNAHVPGSNWFPLMLAVIPLSIATAVRKHADSEVTLM
jgi:hypothetical protein